MSRLEIRNFTRSARVNFPFDKALEAVLPGWELSLVFAGEKRAKSLNISLRGKDYIPNVLSYVVGPKSGEIIICPEVAKRQAFSYDLSTTAMIGFLFIHGLLHLKGVVHGDTMDIQERALLKRFINVTTSNVPTHRNRNRYRNTPHENRGGRGGKRT
ncbi:MAG: rRNA maturation RNase YbeY [Bacillota bacterium]